MKKQNFTLAELIVSAIPLLAMALMLPALYAKSVTETTVTACMNNQKQISIALHAYAPAYGGHAPYVDYELGEGGSNATRVTWASALSSGQFLKDNASYFCPAAAPLFKGTLGEQRSRMNGTETCISQPQKYLERYRFINYGINHEYIAGNFGNWHSGNAKELVTMKLADIKNPAGKIMAADAWNGGETNSFGRHLISGNIVSNRSNRINPCHGGSAVILWSDGHVTLQEKPNEIIQKGDAATIRHYFNATKGE